MLFRRKKGLDFNRRRRKVNYGLMKKVAIWTAEIIIVMLLAFACVHFFGKRVAVVGDSMTDTLKNEQQVFVNKFIYKIRKPKKNDIVVFKPNGNTKSHYYLRRVVATPGDTVQIKDGAVYVNGKIYQDEREYDSIENPGVASKKIKLKKDEYFVLGDNRNYSEDSRYSNIGNVNIKYIEGKAWLRVVPFSDFGLVK
ncbi:signal peptidase I [Lachnospiraceae bacterium C7]|nr:signal peptidase I [Lachnospiraceae bacterium C7]